jgi:transposase
MKKKNIIEFEQVIEHSYGMDVNKGFIVATIHDKGIKMQTSCIEPCKVERELPKSIPVVGKDGATCIIAEVGVDMRQFPDQNHLASWAEVCPGINQTACKNKADASPTVENMRSILTECGWAASRTKNSYLSSRYKNIVGRRGKKKAIIALRHKILIAA